MHPIIRPLSTLTEAAIYNHYRDQVHEFSSFFEELRDCSRNREPLTECLRRDVGQFLKQISAKKIPRARILRENDKRNVGVALAHIRLIEVLGASTGEYGTVPLYIELQQSDTVANAMVACWPDVWRWLQWMDDHSLKHLPPKDTPSSLQYLVLGFLGNLVAAYGMYSDITLEVLYSTPRYIYPLTVYHVRGNSGMEQSMKIAILLNQVAGKDQEHLLPLFVDQMVEAASVDGKDGPQNLACSILSYLLDVLKKPAPQWKPCDSNLFTLFFGILESITIGSIGVRDALLDAKVVPITVRTINKFSDSYIPQDPAGISRIVTSAVSYLRTIQGESKSWSWIPQLIKSGVVPALLRSARVIHGTSQDSPRVLCGPRDPVEPEEHIRHTWWMIGKFLPMHCMRYSLLSEIDKACQAEEIESLTSESTIMDAVGKKWWDFIAFKDSRLKYMNIFHGNESFRFTNCAYPECGIRALPREMKRCAQCKLERYCSEVCQSAHWSAHKARCKAIQQKRHAEKLPRICADDYSFVWLAVNLDARAKRRLIQRLINEYYEGHPEEKPWHAIVRMEYNVFPLKINIISNAGEGCEPTLETNVEYGSPKCTCFAPGQYKIQAFIRSGKSGNEIVSTFLVKGWEEDGEEDDVEGDDEEDEVEGDDWQSESDDDDGQDEHSEGSPISLATHVGEASPSSPSKVLTSVVEEVD